ncbi:cytochrome P450 [Frondihabitans sucicola]|uniref:Cytochrome P450 n=1 Tax=Frondihabitans sucicola TaxID=1268041 RepID=A0ABN6XVB9_9MICO|nr:cytochrome P450 [Frondihabitans sucicola]BDZ48849.1 cytochrome P450 [Frondihabitans sucicola]
MENPTVDKVPTAGCPFHGLEALPADGTLLHPSPALAELRSSARATPLKYTGDHVGWFVTDYELAKRVLEDSRLGIHSERVPASSGESTNAELDDDVVASLLDADAIESLAVSNVLNLNSPQHEKMRRAMTGRFMVKAVRGREPAIREIVQRQLQRLQGHDRPVDITTEYALPISAHVHCLALGVPDGLIDSYVRIYNDEPEAADQTDFVRAVQEQFDLVRTVLEEKRRDLSGDALSDLLRAGLTDRETEGAAWILMSVGRDNVARMISTMTVALLENPEQLAILRDDPTLVPGAVEEIVRYGSPFVGLFVRTAIEDADIDDLHIDAGQSVTVSAVAANRDPKRFEHPDDFDVTRDAFGHLGFGFGAHSCVGQQLARVEIRLAIEALILGIPSLRLVSAAQLEPMPFAHPVGMHDTGSVVVEW